MESSFDRVIAAGRVFCARGGWNRKGAVAVRGDRIAACAATLSREAGRRMEFPHGVLLPGLVDLHAHPARAGSKFGVDPDRFLLTRGTTTVMSQGDAGASNWRDYARHTSEPSRTRVLLALNLSSGGESGSDACLADVNRADVAACVSAVAQIRAEGVLRLWGIAVNTSRASCGASDPREVMRRALAAAEETGLPLLVGTRRHDDWALEDQLPLLRPGDVVTYCFHAMPQGLVDRGHVRDCAWQARERGVLFDLGHGRGSFSFEVAEAAIGAGFGPDTLSTDYYLTHALEDPDHDLPGVISKVIAAGWTEEAAFKAATIVPARVLGLDHEIGALQPGWCADLTVLARSETPQVLTDTVGRQRCAPRWRTVHTLCAGKDVI